MQSEYRRVRTSVRVLDSPGVLLYRLEEPSLERAEPVVLRHVRVLVDRRVLLLPEPDDVPDTFPLPLDIGVRPVYRNVIDDLRETVVTEGGQDDPHREGRLACSKIEPRKSRRRGHERFEDLRLVDAAETPQVLPVELLIGEIHKQVVEHHLPPLLHLRVLRKVGQE